MTYIINLSPVNQFSSWIGTAVFKICSWMQASLKQNLPGALRGWTHHHIWKSSCQRFAFWRKTRMHMTASSALHLYSWCHFASEVFPPPLVIAAHHMLHLHCLSVLLLLFNFLTYDMLYLSMMSICLLSLLEYKLVVLFCFVYQCTDVSEESIMMPYT